MSKTNYHVVPSNEGGWNLKADNSKRAIKHCDTQKEAISKGITVAKNQHAELIIHGVDGKIREKNSYGNDPFPPRG